MALVLAILAGVLGPELAKALGNNGDKAKIKQKVLNKVDIKAISKLTINDEQKTKINTMLITSVSLNTGLGCTLTVDGNINMGATGRVNIYNMIDVANTISSKQISDLQQEINNQLEASINQVNKELLSFLSSEQNASLTADVKNILNKTVKSDITQKSLQQTSVVTGGIANNTFTCGCQKEIPNNPCYKAAEAGVKAVINISGDLNVTSDLWIDITLQALMNTVIDNFIKDKSVLDWTTKEVSTIKQEKQGIFSQIVDALKQWWFLFLGAGIFVFLVIVLLFVLLFFGGGGKEAVQNWSANQIEMQRQGLQMLRENPQLLAAL